MPGLCLFARGRLGTNGQRWAVSWKAEAKGLSKRKLGSGKAALIQPALSLCSPHAGVRKPCFHMGCPAWALGWKQGGFSMGCTCFGEGFQVLFLFSLVHPSRGQQEVPWAPIALPWVLLQSTCAWCWGELSPIPFRSPALGHLQIVSSFAGLCRGSLGL